MMPAALIALGVAVTTLHWPGVSGAANTPRWALLAVLLALILFVVPGLRRWTTAGLFGAALVAWALLSLSWSVAPLDGIDKALKIVLVLGPAFALGAMLDDIEPLFVGAGIGIAINGGIAAAQLFGFSGIAQAFAPAGLFVNCNFLAEAAALTAIYLALVGRYTLAALCLPALLLPVSRAAMLSVIAVAVVMLWRKSPIAVVGLAAACIVAAGLTVATGYRTFSVHERMAIWSDTTRQVTVIGHGLGSFREQFPKAATATDIGKQRPAHAHNEALNLGFELGLIGLILAALFVLSLFGPLTPARLVLIAFAVEASFAFPLHLPTTAFLALILAGHVAGGRGHVRAAPARG